MKSFIKLIFLFILLTLFTHGSGSYQKTVIVEHQNNEMGNYKFWLKKIKKPDKVILSKKDILWFNHLSTKKKYNRDPLKIKTPIKGKNIKKNLLSSIKYIKRFKKYDKNNKYLKDPQFSNKLKKLLNINKIPKIIKSRYALVINKTYLRVFPTETMVLQKTNDVPFDILQNDFLDIGDELAFLHISTDKKWAYVRARQGSGWVLIKDIAWTYNKKQLYRFVHSKKYIVALNWSVPVYSNSNCSIFYGTIHMGKSLPRTSTSTLYHSIVIPKADKQGQLKLTNAYVKNTEAVSTHLLALTPRNIGKQAFHMLGEPYSWGGRKYHTDCSSYLRRIFRTMGLQLPRFSFYQIKLLKKVTFKKRKKNKILEKLEPFQTFLYYPQPSHVMLYIGKNKNRHYVIHNKWSYKKTKEKKEKEIFLKKIIINDLSLGEGSIDGSLLERMTHISKLD